MGKKSPKQPDPAQLAAQQTQTNKETAIWNSALNNVNQITPYGNITWTLGSATPTGGTQSNSSQSGGQSGINSGFYVGNDGKVYSGTRDQITSQYKSNNPYSGSLATNPYIGWAGKDLASLGFKELGGSSNATGAANGGSSGGSQWGDLPQWTSTITLSPEQQAILDSQNRQDIALGQLGERQIGRIGDATANPYSYDGIQNALPTYGSIEQAQNAAQEALMSRINPQFAQQEEALRTRLINQGIGQGSQAYQREMDILNQQRNDAQQQAVLNAQQYGSNAQNQALQRRLQEIEEYNAMRNAPLNEYIGMTSGTQVTNPQFTSGNYSGIQPYDISGAMINQYNNQQAQANNQQGAMSSLFGLGGSLIGGPAGGFLGSAVGSLFSDARLKENVKHVGEENGFPVYEFEYVKNKGLPEGRFKGVMAQDVKEIMPDAVHEVDGYMMVNYDMIGVSMREVA